MVPLFDKNDLQMFKKYLDRSSVYFEYGCGGSTYEACKRPNIKKVSSPVRAPRHYERRNTTRAREQAVLHPQSHRVLLLSQTQADGMIYV